MTPFFERNFANSHTDNYLLGMCSRKKWSFFMTFAIKRQASSPPLPLLVALFSNDFFTPLVFLLQLNLTNMKLLMKENQNAN